MYVYVYVPELNLYTALTKSLYMALPNPLKYRGLAVLCTEH
jgi:hypothetical protein